MLSYIYRLIRNFENEHEVTPNLLHLNRIHFEHLKSAFGSDYTLEKIMSLLKMEVIISQSIAHPQVSWSHIASRRVS